MSGAPETPMVSATGAAGDPAEAGQSKLQRLAGLQSVWILGVLIVICLVFSVMSPDRFLSYGNITTITQNVSIWAVLAVGMTFVIITAGIDLSIGSVLVCSSVVSAMVMEKMGDTGWGTAMAGLAISLLVGLGWGLFNGFIITKLKVPPLITTLGTLSIPLGVAQILTDGLDIRSAPKVLQDTIGYGKIFGLPTLSIIALITVVVGGIVLHKTRFGRYVYAIGSNELAARRVGINVDRKLLLVYAFTGLLGGFAGFLALAQFGTTTIAGQSLTNLNVIAAVVIGGTSIWGGRGSMFGSMVGLFIPAVLQAGFVIVGVSPYWQTVAVGTILIAAVYVDQHRRAAAMRSGRKARKSRTQQGAEAPKKGGE